MKAVGIFLVVEEIKEKPTKTKGGLLLTDKIKEDVRYRKGIIKSAGNLVEGLKDGDTVYYDKNAGFGVEVEDKFYLVIRQPDVVIVL